MLSPSQVSLPDTELKASLPSLTAGAVNPPSIRRASPFSLIWNSPEAIPERGIGQAEPGQNPGQFASGHFDRGVERIRAGLKADNALELGIGKEETSLHRITLDMDNAVDG